MENKHSFNRTIIGSIGKKGNEAGEFTCPCSICYDEWNDHLIVGDCSHRIQLFDSKTLKYHSQFGSEGSQYGQFINPTKLCIQPFTHNLLICDLLNHRIQVFDTGDASHYSFLYQIKFHSTNNYPRSICCDEKGHILVCDTGNDTIHEFNESGQFLHVLGSHGFSTDQFHFPNDIYYNKKHKQLLVADTFNKRVSVWSHDSSSKPQPLSHIQIDNYCYSVCIDPLRNHQIFIGTVCNVFVYDSRNHKEPIQTLGTYGSELGEFNGVTGLCVNEQDGTLLIVDQFNHRIQLFK